MIPSRRRFLLGASALLAAPSIVRVASLMPVSVLTPDADALALAAERRISIFVRLTQRYVDAGAARLGEISLPEDVRTFAVNEAWRQVPRLVP